MQRHTVVRMILLSTLASVVTIAAPSKYAIAQQPHRAANSSLSSSAKNSSLSAAALRLKGKELFDQGKYQAAVAELDVAIKLDPKNSEAYSFRGRAYLRLGQFERTIADCNQALTLNPQNTLCLIVRGLAYLSSSNDTGRALADFNTAGKIRPSDPAPFAFRGLAYSSMGEPELAIAEINKAIRIDPSYGPSYAHLGDAYTRLQKYEDALVAQKKSVALAPNNPLALVGRAFAYLNLGNTELALADYNEALRFSPGLYTASLGRGKTYLAKGAYDAAIADFSKALLLKPGNVSALLQRAKAYELSQRLPEARADFQTTLDIFPSHGVAAAGIDRIDAKLGAGSGVARRPVDHAGVRTALVIGNSRYNGVNSLKNPKHDAILIANALRGAGFLKVQLLIDGTRESMAAALKAFVEDAENADWAVVYYAGHGIELDGSNYLVPIDVKYENDADIPKESIALDQVINAVAKASKLRLIVLDACRDNPFIADMKGLQPSAAGRGLARIEPESGTLVAFATKHGNVATDGMGENSPLATALANRIELPGIEINQLFRLVHDDVLASTSKQQEPFTYGQLSAEAYYFRQ